MSIVEIVILGLALSMDAFAVTISNSFAYPNISRVRSFSMPLAFGFFQFLMPVVGFVLGQLVSDVITQYAGIITFVILGFIGGKMIWDAFHEEEGEEASEQTLTMPVLLFQAVANGSRLTLERSHMHFARAHRDNRPTIVFNEQAP